MRMTLRWITAPLLGIILAGGIAACGTTGQPPRPEPKVKVVEVMVPVAKSCVPKNLAAPPVYVDSDEALAKAPNAAVRYLLVTAGRLQRIARLGEVEPVVEICRD